MVEEQAKQDIMTKYFYDIRKIEGDIISKRIEIMNLKNRLYNITGFNFSDIYIKGKVKESFSEIDDIIEKEKELSIFIQQQNIMRKKYEDQINMVCDVNQRLLLKTIYLDHQDLKYVSSLFQKSYSYVKKIKSKAIENFLKVNSIHM